MVDQRRYCCLARIVRCRGITWDQRNIHDIQGPAYYISIRFYHTGAIGGQPESKFFARQACRPLITMHYVYHARLCTLSIGLDTHLSSVNSSFMSSTLSLPDIREQILTSTTKLPSTSRLVLYRWRIACRGSHRCSAAPAAEVFIRGNFRSRFRIAGKIAPKCR